MTEPLFHIGQPVAVCTSRLSIVIPKTVVRGARYVQRGRFTKLRRSGQCVVSNYTGIIYVVDGYDDEIAESCLRPINPDTEYQDQPQTTEVPGTQETVSE